MRHHSPIRLRSSLRALSVAASLAALAGCAQLEIYGNGRAPVRPGTDVAFPESDTRTFLETLLNPCERLRAKQGPTIVPTAPLNEQRACPRLGVPDSVAMDDSVRRVVPQRIP